MARILSIFLFLLSQQVAALTLSDVKIEALNPYCTGDSCIVLFKLHNLDHLDPALLTEENSLDECGSENDKTDFFNNSLPPAKGKGRIAIVVRSPKDGRVAKICNPNRIKAYAEFSSEEPVLPVVFTGNTPPEVVNLALKDRILNSKIISKVRIPKKLQNKDIKCDGNFYRSNGELRLGPLTTPLRKVVNYCWDLSSPVGRSIPIGRPFFELSTVNLANWHCSSLLLRTVSPSNKVSFSYGSQPGTAPDFEPGVWKVQLLLSAGCDRYKFTISGAQ